MDNEATRIGAPGSAHGAGQLAIGSILAHTFEIVRFIRAGGMGEVYEARHLVDGSRLAVKFIRPDLVGDERIRAMFVREAGILRRIRDDAVVSYEGLLQDEQGRSFLAMSYVDGPSLAERAQIRPLGTDEAMRLLTRLARGLARVHAEGTFHRDLSPDNILLPDGDLDRAVIIDFGIAKLAEPQAGTLVGGDIAGKASYMSPEQLGVIRQRRRCPLGHLQPGAHHRRRRAGSVADAPAAAGPRSSRHAAMFRISTASTSRCAAVWRTCCSRIRRTGRRA